MHILITGANGQLGQTLQTTLRGETLTLIDLPEVDITTPGTPADIIRQTRPDLVIHCAAYTDVDGCARDRSWPIASMLSGHKCRPRLSGHGHCYGPRQY